MKKKVIGCLEVAMCILFFLSFIPFGAGFSKLYWNRAEGIMQLAIVVAYWIIYFIFEYFYETKMEESK